jgi:hypothetical protein
MSKSSFAALSLFSLACLPGVAKAQFVIAESTFDSGFDGWDDAGSEDISWQSTGGNPGGYVRLVDTGQATGVLQNSNIYAPSEFLGDWSSYDGIGTISFDLATFQVGTVARLRNYNVYISNDTASISAEWLGPVHSGLVNFWGDEDTQFSVPIIEADWSVSGGTWTDLLAEVTLLRMELEQVVSDGAPRDISGIDNISLSIPCDTIDTDGDGTSDCIDDCSTDPDKIAPGACGCGIADTDTDGDGTSDCTDDCPTDPDKIAPGICGCEIADDDTDDDGTLNCFDQCPTDPDKTVPGQCGCHIPDDADSDGIADCRGVCGAFGMISWTFLMLGFVGLRLASSNRRKTRIKR